MTRKMDLALRLLVLLLAAVTITGVLGVVFGLGFWGRVFATWPFVFGLWMWLWKPVTPVRPPGDPKIEDSHA